MVPCCRRTWVATRASACGGRFVACRLPARKSRRSQGSAAGVHQPASLVRTRSYQEPDVAAAAAAVFTLNNLARLSTDGSGPDRGVPVSSTRQSSAVIRGGRSPAQPISIMAASTNSSYHGGGVVIDIIWKLVGCLLATVDRTHKSAVFDVLSPVHCISSGRPSAVLNAVTC